MSGNPKECRRNALTCMQLAQTAPSPEAREHFAELSQTWLRLAGDIVTPFEGAGKAGKLRQQVGLPWQHNTFLTAKRKPAGRGF